MYAIVRQGGKQYRIAAGEELVLDRLQGDIGESFSFEKLLLVSDEGKTVVTNEDLARYEIKAEVIEHFNDKKILVFKYKPKKGYRRTKGHRQSKTRLSILSIEALDGQIKTTKTKAAAKETGTAVKAVKTEAKDTPAAESKTKPKTAAKPKAETEAKVSKSTKKPQEKSEKPAQEA